MQEGHPATQGAMEMMQETLGGPLKNGEIGVLLASAGVGKTACLTHIALEHILNGNPVLHVSIGGVPDKIKAWYHEFLKNVTAAVPGGDILNLQYRIEPLRFILAYLHHSFSTDKLELSLQNLKSQAKFYPSMVVLDGLDCDPMSRPVVERLQDIAQKYNLSMWLSANTHQPVTTVNERDIPYPCHETDDLFNSIVLLEAEPDSIRVKLLKHKNIYKPEQPLVHLNPRTFLIEKG
ncbi:MAG: hypothetical protein AB2L11_04715 [Syntrophobacteraceae bacterium]